MPRANVTPPLYPKQFGVEAPGYINFPFQNKTVISLKSDRLLHYLDTDIGTLKYYGRFDLLGPLKLPYNMTHKGEIIYNQLFFPKFCVCNGISVGIFKYDAFMDAKYLGRETKEIEYGVGSRLTDHYLKEPGHNLWMDVETKLPVRFFQAGMGLSVYKNWKIGPPGPAIMNLPEGCFNVGGCEPVEADRKSFVSPLDHMATMLSKHLDHV